MEQMRPMGVIVKDGLSLASQKRFGCNRIVDDSRELENLQ